MNYQEMEAGGETFQGKVRFPELLSEILAGIPMLRRTTNWCLTAVCLVREPLRTMG